MSSGSQRQRAAGSREKRLRDTYPGAPDCTAGSDAVDRRSAVSHAAERAAALVAVVAVGVVGVDAVGHVGRDDEALGAGPGEAPRGLLLRGGDDAVEDAHEELARGPGSQGVR